MRLSQRTLALILLACLGAPGWSQTPLEPSPPASSDEEMEPKFIWGLLLNIVFKYAMQTFGAWLSNKLTTEMTPSTTQRLLLESTSAIIVTLADSSPWGAKSVSAVENTRIGAPTGALRKINDKENYQGMHVALVEFDSNNMAIGLKSVGSGFKTGDRIKLKILPTFDGLLVIDNVSPSDERKQIYPAQPKTALAVKSGVEILVPVAADEFFEFAGATGAEQLLITLRDIRAFGDAASAATVSRQDDATGSSFVQEVGNGTFPVISQSLKLSHGR